MTYIWVNYSIKSYFAIQQYTGPASQTHVLPAGSSESTPTRGRRQHSGFAQTCRQIGPAPVQLYQRLLIGPPRGVRRTSLAKMQLLVKGSSENCA